MLYEAVSSYKRFKIKESRFRGVVNSYYDLLFEKIFEEGKGDLGFLNVYVEKRYGKKVKGGALYGNGRYDYMGALISEDEKFWIKLSSQYIRILNKFINKEPSKYYFEDEIRNKNELIRLQQNRRLAQGNIGRV